MACGAGGAGMPSTRPTIDQSVHQFNPNAEFSEVLAEDAASGPECGLSTIEYLAEMKSENATSMPSPAELSLRADPRLRTK
jgi:hypothetical protein